MTLRPSSSVDFLKSGHTLSLDSHKIENAEMVHSRSARVLLSRGSAYPVPTPDYSAEFTEENLLRRSAHKRILTADPSAFRRKALPEGTSHHLNEMNRMKVFLGDMHKPKDLQDVDMTRRSKLTFSLRTHIDALESAEREEYKFNTLKPLEDFVQPDSPTQSRSTGYEPGHVRSLLRLDSFGPASSMRAQQERAIGRVPHVHNIDRFMVSEPLGGTASPGNTSRVSTASSYNSYEFAPVRYKGDRGPRTTLPKKTLRYTNNQISAAELSQWGVRSPGGERVDMHAMHGMFHSSSNAIPRAASRPVSPKEAAVAAGDKLMVNFHSTFTNPTTAALIAQQEARRRPTKQLSRGSSSATRLGVSAADRLTLDPLLKRTLWYKTYAQNEAERREATRTAHREARHQAAQRELAAEEQRAVRDFERHLVLARIQV